MPLSQIKFVSEDYTPNPPFFQLFWIDVTKPEILRSFDAFAAAVSSGGMFGTGLILPGAARSVYAILGGSVSIFRFPAGFRFTGLGSCQVR